MAVELGKINFGDLVLEPTAEKLKKLVKRLKQKVPGWVQSATGKFYVVDRTDFQGAIKKTSPFRFKKVNRFTISTPNEYDLTNITFTYKTKRKPILGLNNSLAKNKVKISKKKTKPWNMRQEKEKGKRGQDFIFGWYRLSAVKKRGKETAKTTYQRTLDGILKKTKIRLLAYSAKEPDGSGWKMHIYKTMAVSQMIRQKNVQEIYNKKIEELIIKALSA